MPEEPGADLLSFKMIKPLRCLESVPPCIPHGCVPGVVGDDDL